MMKMTVSIFTKGLGKDLRKKVRAEARKAITADAILVRNEAIRLMSKGVQAEAARVARGPLSRDKATGRFSSGGASNKGGSTGRSKPGEIPRSETGNYKKSIRYKVAASGRFAFVGASQPQGAHAGLLKWGSVRMKPRLVPVEVALRNVNNKLANPFGNLF